MNMNHLIKKHSDIYSFNKVIIVLLKLIIKTKKLLT